MNGIAKKAILFFLLFSSFAGLAQTSKRLSSPDGLTEITINFESRLDELIKYSVSHKGEVILKRSNIGLQFKDGIANDGWKISTIKQGSYNKTWKQVYGEKATITDRYNALIVTYSHKNTQINIFFRVYNEGVAYRYSVLQKGALLNLTAEKSDFAFSKNDTAWVSSNAQGPLKAKPINEIKEASERPLTVKHNEKLYFALGEAGLVDFARMKLICNKDLTLSSVLSGEVTNNNEVNAPWRYILIGNSPGDLLEKNYLLLNLNEPNQIKNTSWIKPGKVIRENSLTTDGSFETIDFAAKHHIPYVSFDAGWYGKEDADTSDASRVMVDPARSKGPLDLQRVIAYGKERNVGIILYVNRRALERQLDELLPLYQKWGIKGIKFGFVRVGDQKWTNWLHNAIRKAAKYEMLVDVHDEYRPTGYSRTYPNLMTQEGVRGDEESPTNELVLTTVFTRMIAGAADQTNAYFTKRVDKMGSHASQMAKTICIYSPLQFIYWYDRPAGKKNNPNNEGVINEVAELDFYDRLPTVWDDTKVLEGQIGNFATIARKKGGEWYVGSLTNLARNVKIDLQFLDKNKSYTAYIYKDDASLTTLTRIAIEEKKVDYRTVLSFQIKNNNGLAIRLTPTN
jgi:alpha-glucosidase